MGETQKSLPLNKKKRGGGRVVKAHAVLRGEGGSVELMIFSFVAPPPSVIDDMSLRITNLMCLCLYSRPIQVAENQCFSLTLTGSVQHYAFTEDTQQANRNPFYV